jgi:HEAT repeat protein
LRAQALLLAATARAPGVAEAAVQAVLEPSMVEPAQRALSMLGADALPAMLAFIEREPDPDIWEGVDDASASLIDAAVVIAQGAAVTGSSPDVPWVELLSALRKSVRGSSTLVATSALYGLAKIGSDADLSLAAELTSAVSLPVARAAEVALATLAERHAGPARVFARRMMQREETYLPAVILLDTLDVAGPDELGFFSHVASSGNVRARRAAVLALATRAGALSLDVLSLALADEERDVRLAAALALGRLCAMLEGATGLVGDAAARARELLALVHASRDPDLVSAAAQGGASVEQGSDFKSRRSGRPPGWYVP